MAPAGNGDRKREPEPSLGPDEEGEVPLDPVPDEADRPGAWVRSGGDREDEGRPGGTTRR